MTPEEQSRYLAQEIQKLQSAFDQGMREKEELFRQAGITPERLKSAAAKLANQDQKRVEEAQRQLDAQMAALQPAAAATPASNVKARGIRV